MRDRRGFRYALEPLRLKCEWDLNELATHLGSVNAALASRQAEHDALAAAYQAECDAWRQGQQGMALLVPELQRMQQAYLLQLDGALQQAQTRLTTLEQQRDAVVQQTASLRKFSDGVDRHRDDALKDHERRMESAAVKDADDAWLQRRHREESLA